MAVALVLEPIDELVALSVSPLWLSLPDEWREGLAYWSLSAGVLMQDGVRPVGPPRDVEWTFAQKPQDIVGIKLRHPCDDCQATIGEAAEMLATKPDQVVAIAQFTIDYLRTPEEMASGEPGRRVYRARPRD